jgi:hypothetical protein
MLKKKLELKGGKKKVLLTLYFCGGSGYKIEHIKFLLTEESKNGLFIEKKLNFGKKKRFPFHFKAYVFFCSFGNS